MTKSEIDSAINPIESPDNIMQRNKFDNNESPPLRINKMLTQVNVNKETD